jgi:hypothetical protein
MNEPINHSEGVFQILDGTRYEQRVRSALDPAAVEIIMEPQVLILEQFLAARHERLLLDDTPL